MNSKRDSIQTIQDLCDLLPTHETSPKKEDWGSRIENQDFSSVSKLGGSDDSPLGDTLKPDAMKSIIREEIVKKGYDTIDFAQFLATFQREKRISDGKWTMLQLYEMILKFRENNTPSALPEDSFFLQSRVSESFLNGREDNSPSKDQTRVSQEDKSILQDEKSLRRKAILGQNKDPYKDKIYVKKLEPTVLSGMENLIVSIDEAKTKKGGVFSSDYISYCVKIDSLGWSTQRRAEEFVALQSSLQKARPGLVLPKFSKKITREKFKEESIQKKIYVFERFLQSCLANKEIRSTKTFCDFLSGNDKGFFSSGTPKSEKTKVTNVSEMFTLTGEVLIDISPEVSSHISLAEKYQTQANKSFIQLKKLGKKLSAGLDQVANTLLEIGEQYLDLFKITKDFNQNATVGKNKLENIFLELNKTVKNWGEHLAVQAKSVRKNIVGFYTFASYEAQAFMNRCQSRVKQQAEYERVEKELNMRKEKLYGLADPDRWELDQQKSRGVPRDELINDKEIAFACMLSKDSEQLMQLKDSYGYVNYSTYNEMIKVFEVQYDDYKNNFQEFLKRQVDSTSQMYSDWADFVTGLEVAKKERL